MIPTSAAIVGAAFVTDVRVNREMMRLVTLDVPNTAMAVSIDTGDVVALHPKNKRPIGIRHAYLALKQTYGKDLIDCGPRFIGQAIQGHSIVLRFDSIGGGMVSARPGKLDAFAIAGEDKVWHWADAEIQGKAVKIIPARRSSGLAVERSEESWRCRRCQIRMP